jgi:acyl phosphate:glycerol-3-phosphate acyltransferase
MNNILMVVIFMITGYLFGSFPTGVIIGKKLKNIDIREHGSKNSGATNAYRVLGTKFGLAVLIIDILKGFIPLMIAKQLGIGDNTLIIIGITAIIGHTFSPFLNFKGGKGVATSLGVFLYLVPYVILTLILIFIVIVYFSKYISLASITVSFLFPILVLLFDRVDPKDNKWVVFSAGVIIAAYIILKHKSNIVRLIKGTENKFYGK